MDDRACVFCAIVRREEPAAIIFEDEHTLAFLDITAVTPGHTLVVPKHHAIDLWEITEDSAVLVMRTVHLMARRLQEVLAPEGLTLFQANRQAGWQDVFHLHVHLVPRTTDDRLSRPWRAQRVSLASLEEIRARLTSGAVVH